MRKLRLSRSQLASFLKDDDQISHFEQLFSLSDNIGTKLSVRDGGTLTAAAVISALEVGESSVSFYKASGGTHNITLPSAGTYAYVVVTSVPATSVAYGAAGGALVAGLASGASLFVAVLRLT